MKITLVMGFFLPMPPVAGGATEKSWHGLASEFLARGHEVTIVSREWPQSPSDERTPAGLRHRRLRGYDHQPGLLANLWRDLWWSIRVSRALPEADVTVVNCVTLPLWLGWLCRRAGRVVVMTGRMPKGQYHFYQHVDRVLAVSTATRTAVLAENPQLDSRVRVCGYPIRWTDLAKRSSARPDQAPITLGYVGRLHREKGLDLFVAALALLATRPGLPPWRVVLCGPSDVSRGGSGPDYAVQLQQALARSLPTDRHQFLEPVFAEDELAAIYQSIDVFCYPSLAAHGETFGVAVAEAMAAGAVPVVSRLACFADLVRDGANGKVFDHLAADAPARLADTLAGLLADPAARARLADAARTSTSTYDYPAFAQRLLADFSALK